MNSELEKRLISGWTLLTLGALGLLIIVFWLQWTAISACIEEKACSDPRTKPVYMHGACVCLERAR